MPKIMNSKKPRKVRVTINSDNHSSKVSVDIVFTACNITFFLSDVYFVVLRGGGTSCECSDKQGVRVRSSNEPLFCFFVFLF